MNPEIEIVNILMSRGNELLKQPYEEIVFTNNKDSDGLLNNLKDFPHAFVLACLMDRQVKAERAWSIPYEIFKEIGGFEFPKLLELSLENIVEIFSRKNLHRFNEKMAEIFFLGIKKIHNEYNDDASLIWKGNPRSATVVRKFLGFHGSGIKIATMAANILVRDFKITMEDHICIDISPDVHVKRVFQRLGFLSKNPKEYELIYRARELNPLYPGIFDLSCWEIGRNLCKPKNPNCQECYLSHYCPKIVLSED